MRIQEIEAWGLSVVELVKSGKKVEDDRVELKSIWLDPQRAARRIAGHANSSLGSVILWIIGLDETGIIHSSDVEFSNWWPQVNSHFEGVTPRPRYRVLKVSQTESVHVLLFETEEGPYIVKNEKYGSSNGGCVEREVPWREGTSVRSAYREDLIRMLIPTVKVPHLDPISMRVSLTRSSPETEDSAEPILSTNHFKWFVALELYVAPKDDKQVVIPVHTSQLECKISNLAPIIFKPTFSPYVSYYHGTPGINTIVESPLIRATKSEVILDGPGRLNINCQLVELPRQIPTADEIETKLVLGVVNSHKPVICRNKLVQTLSDQDTITWELTSTAVIHW